MKYPQCFNKAEIDKLQCFSDVVSKYIEGFKQNCSDKNTLINLELKEDHSFNVTQHCLNIASSENLSSDKCFIAFLCGLFHDIGRFEQFTVYNTFRDDDSVYHGAIGAEVIEKEVFLKDLPIQTQKIIIAAVLNHGLREIPRNTNGDELYFSKLIRDADKADIYRIVAKYYNSIGPRNIALEYGLKDKPSISSKVFEIFRSGQTVSKDDLQTLNDFKLMQISWIYDLNFAYTRSLVHDNGYAQIVLNSMNCEADKVEIMRILVENGY